MINKFNIVFTRIKTSVSNLCANTSTTFQSSPSSFPYLYVKQLDNAGDSYDMDRNENSVLSKVEVQVYTNGTSALSTNNAIFNLADAEIIKSGYRRIYGVSQLDNLSDSTITYQVARYQRIICDGDSL